jgi:hypothetical protein
VDGLDLVTHIHRTGIRTYPFGHPDLPDASTAEEEAIDLEIVRLLDTHDAIADLALAEGVHQAVLGNMDRVAASFDAYSKGGFPPEPAILETPRSGTALTHRFGLHLRSGLDHRDSPIAGLAMTPRAVAEPAVNDLLARMMPDPAAVVGRVSWRDRSGADHERTVAQADLGLQPIDMLHLLNPGGQAMTELDDRIVRLVESEEALPPDVVATVTIHYTDRVAGQTTFFELAPLVTHLRSLVTRSRPLRATDLLPSNEARRTVDTTTAQAYRDRPAAVLTALDDWRTAAGDLATEVDALLADPAAHRDTLLAGVDTFIDRTSALLLASGSFGLPGSGLGDIAERRLALLTQLFALVDEVIER